MKLAPRTEVLVERPYLFHSEDYAHCSYCQCLVIGEASPCQSCNERSFCSAQCSAQDSADGHGIFCGTPYNFLKQLGPISLMVGQMMARVGGPATALLLEEAARSDFSLDQYLGDNSMEGKELGFEPRDKYLPFLSFYQTWFRRRKYWLLKHLGCSWTEIRFHDSQPWWPVN